MNYAIVALAAVPGLLLVLVGNLWMIATHLRKRQPSVVGARLILNGAGLAISGSTLTVAGEAQSLGFPLVAAAALIGGALPTAIVWIAAWRVRPAGAPGQPIRRVTLADTSEGRETNLKRAIGPTMLRATDRPRRIALGLAIPGDGPRARVACEPDLLPGSMGGLAQPVTACFDPTWSRASTCGRPTTRSSASRPTLAKAHGPNDPVIPVGSEIDGARSSPPAVLRLMGPELQSPGLPGLLGDRSRLARQTGDIPDAKQASGQ